MSNNSVKDWGEFGKLVSVNLSVFHILKEIPTNTVKFYHLA